MGGKLSFVCQAARFSRSFRAACGGAALATLVFLYVLLRDRGIVTNEIKPVGIHGLRNLTQKTVGWRTILPGHLHRQHPAFCQDACKPGHQGGVIRQPVQGRI